MASLHIIYASTSGHTEYVVDLIGKVLAEKAPTLTVSKVLAEQATPEDLVKASALILACGTWNTGGIEGQLNPHMHAFLLKRAAATDLKGQRVALVALGDKRYFYTARAGEHLKNFVETHGGKQIGETLTIVNEPYGQENQVHAWADTLLSLLSK